MREGRRRLGSSLLSLLLHGFRHHHWDSTSWRLRSEGIISALKTPRAPDMWLSGSSVCCGHEQLTFRFLRWELCGMLETSIQWLIFLRVDSRLNTRCTVHERSLFLWLLFSVSFLGVRCQYTSIELFVFTSMSAKWSKLLIELTHQPQTSDLLFRSPIINHPIYSPYIANCSSALNLSISSSRKQTATAISPSGAFGIR